MATRLYRQPSRIPPWMRGIPLIAASIGAALAEMYAYLLREAFPERITMALIRLSEQNHTGPYWRRYY